MNPPTPHPIPHPYVYLAAPYTHDLLSVRRSRLYIVTAFARKACLLGWVVYSPLTLCHHIDLAPVDEDQQIPYDHWLRYADAFVPRATEFWLLRLPGWKTSRGVAYEQRLAVNHNIPIHHFESDSTPPPLV